MALGLPCVLCPALLWSVVTGVLVWVIRKVVRWYTSHRDRVRCLQKFPSLPRHWLYGSIKEFRSGPDFFKMHQERAKEFPYCYTFWNGPFPQLMVQHPDTIKPILKVSYPKHKVYHNYLKPWLGEGLLISEGARWFRNRRLLTPAFHFDVLKSYMNIYNESANIFLDKISSITKSGGSFELFNHMSLLTLDILFKCAFSLKTNCQTIGSRHPYVKSVYELTNLFSQRMGKMYNRYCPMLYWLTSNGRKYSKLCDDVHRQADDVIKRRRTLLKAHGESVLAGKKSLDFLDILLTAKDSDGEGMTPLEIRAEVDTFMFAGHDTTASCLSWTLYALAKHPEYQQLVQEEVDKLLEGRTSPDIIWTDLPHLSFLTQCLKESLRLYGPVLVIGREITQDIVIMDNKVPAGTMVMIPMYALHHNPTVWGVDHMTYDPKRFSPENIICREPYAFVPFSAGPRNCIGQTFALNEMKVVLARLLHRFKFEVAEDSPEEAPVMTIVVRNSQDIRLKAVPR